MLWVPWVPLCCSCQLELDPSPQCRAELGRGAEVAPVSSGKAETLIRSALALGDSAALPPAPMTAQHQDPLQLHPKAKPGCHSLEHLPSAPSLISESPALWAARILRKEVIFPSCILPGEHHPLSSPALWGVQPSHTGQI